MKIINKQKKRSYLLLYWFKNWIWWKYKCIIQFFNIITPKYNDITIQCHEIAIKPSHILYGYLRQRIQPSPIRKHAYRCTMIIAVATQPISLLTHKIMLCILVTQGVGVEILFLSNL